MLYERYQAARNAAWRTLIRFQEERLPVDVERLAEKLGVVITAGTEGLPPGTAALSLREKGKWRIQVRPHLPYSRYRFAVAHELGHLILQHKAARLPNGQMTFEGRQNIGDVLPEADSEADTDADMFAIRLLAPACVLHSLHLTGEKAIGHLCGLPEGAAAMRAERMQLLNARNAYFTHPLEKQLQKQFLPFIREKWAAAVPPAPVQAALPPVLPKAQPASKKPLPLWLLVAPAGLILLLLFLLR